MSHTADTTIIFKGRSFDLKVVEDIDYLLGLVRTDDDVPFWAVLWPAAIAMSEYFWEEISFSRQRVLELGAGLGLVGIVAAAKEASLVQSDFIPEALQLAQENAISNGIDNITYLLADWRKFPVDEKFDWIIGSDILYEPNLYPHLLQVFTNNLKPGGTIALADPGRDDAIRFIEELSSRYKVEIAHKEVFESGRKVNVKLYFLTERT